MWKISICDCKIFLGSLWGIVIKLFMYVEDDFLCFKVDLIYFFIIVWCVCNIFWVFLKICIVCCDFCLVFMIRKLIVFIWWCVWIGFCFCFIMCLILWWLFLENNGVILIVVRCLGSMFSVCFGILWVVINKFILLKW